MAGSQGVVAEPQVVWHMEAAAYGLRTQASRRRGAASLMGACRTVPLAALVGQAAAAAPFDGAARTAGPGEADPAGTAPSLAEAPLATERGHDEAEEQDAGVARGSAAAPGEGGLAASGQAVAVVAVGDHAGRTGSWAAEAFEGSERLEDEGLPNYYRRSTAPVPDLVEEGSESARPIVDLAERQVRPAGTPVGEHPEAVARHPGLADH